MENHTEDGRHKSGTDTPLVTGSNPANDYSFRTKLISTLLIASPVLILGTLGCANFNSVSDQLVYVRYGGALANQNVSNESSSACTTSLNKMSEDEAQAHATQFRLYSRMGRCLVTFLFIPVWGAYSDRTGRHTAVIAGSAGAVIYALALLLVTLVEGVPLWILILGDVIHGILGSSLNTLMVACASYAADVFREGDRTLIMILFDLVFGLSFTLGQIGGGYWIKASGFIPIIVCMLGLLISVLLYGMLFFPKLTKPSFTAARLSENIQNQPKLSITNCFSQTYRTLIRTRSGYKRAYLILIITTVLMMHFSFYGVSNQFTIYVIGPPLCWSSVTVGIVSGVGCATNAFMPLCLGVLFVKRSSQATAWLVFVGLLSDLLHVLIFGLAETTTMMFVGIVVGSFLMLVSSGSRAIITDLVDVSERGAAVAGYYLSGEVAEFLSSPLFNEVFVATVSVYNRAFFFVGALFDTAAILFLGIYGWLKLREKRGSYKPLPTPETKDQHVQCPQ